VSGRRALALAAVLVTVTAVAADAQTRLAVTVFARIPAPGYPASTLVAADGTVYVGTFKSFTDPTYAGPAKVFAYSPRGVLERTYTITGETPNTPEGVQVASTDRQGNLYLLDQAPARVVELNPVTGAERTWATFATVPACTGAPNGDCTEGPSGNAPEPDFAAWGPDGSMYVTDYNQSLIWRIPPGGGTARAWFTSSALNGIIVGPAGIELMPDRHTLMLDTGGGGGDIAAGKLYTLPIEPNGQPGPLTQLWQSAPGAAPDGFAIARSGDVYVPLVGPSGNAVVEISPQGQQLAEVPANPVANETQTIPFDAPGSVTFDGDNILVGNQSSLQNDSAHWAVLEIYVGEPGLPLSLPPATVTATKSRYVLQMTPAHPVPGRRTRFSFLATIAGSAGYQPVAHALIRFDRHRARTSRRGRCMITATLRHADTRYRAILMVDRRWVSSALVATRG
jgi:outer membrane protein assembly factor BamB